MYSHKYILLLLIVSLLFLASCRGDEMIVPSEKENVDVIPMPDSSLVGFYLLNEGNMGSNKCTLDFLNLSTGEYIRNLFAERNPSSVMELGDVGNYLAIYGSRLYIIVNCSHKMEVVDAYTGVSIGKVDIPNCRYVCFANGNAYVSSYVGPVAISQDAPKGAVYEVDTVSLQIKRYVTVGYQPEQLQIVGENIYVANSGGYRAPDYDKTISVVNLSSFRQTSQIDVAPNLNRMLADKYGHIWVSSRGNYSDSPSALYMLSQDRGSNYSVSKKFDIPCSNFAIHNNTVFLISSNRDSSPVNTFKTIDIPTLTISSENFISDGSDSRIIMPYGIAVHPESGDIFITDAKNYVSSGQLLCFSPEGKLLWSVRTGDIPSSIAFLHK